VRLHTFGRAYVTREGQELTLQPLAVAVLAYLTVGGPRDRTHLAELFWPNSTNRLNSLSTTLNRIRAQAPDTVWVRGNTLVGVDLDSDVCDVRDAIDRADFELVSELYRAPFLSDLRLRTPSLEFEEWVLEQRTSLVTTVELALLQQAQLLFTSGDHCAAARVAEEAWEMAVRDGFPSPDFFEMYHRILASAARPSATAVRSMAADIGIELPPVEPIVLMSIAAPEEPSPAPAEPNPASADLNPASNTGGSVAGELSPLFGFERELETVASSATANRLTTLVGLGGSGKTRLAAEYFNSADAEHSFAQRVWVNLRDVTGGDLVAPAIAASFGQRFETVAGLAQQLPDDEPILVVLDNFEHVIDAAGAVEELALGNDALRILVTSRVPLEVAVESLVMLNGLDTAGSESELGSPAEQLFVASACRAGVVGDRLDHSNRAAIGEVCRRVGGNPLALEIAGGWAQVLSPPEILEALSVDNTILGASMAGDLRTVESVLAQSWSALSETEQNTLMLLATFPSGCSTREALKLRELSIGSVGRLVKQSLVVLSTEGRFTLHPLVAGFALAELEKRPDQQRDFQQVLSAWCQSFARTAEQEQPAGTYSPALGAEIANFAQALAWDGEHRIWELHRSGLRPLRLFFADSGQFTEGRALFATIVGALRADPNADRDLLAAALEAHGWFHVLSGDLSHARTLLAEALTVSSGDAPYDQAQILRSLGVLNLHGGEIDEAAIHLNRALELLVNDPSELKAAAQFDLAQVHHYRGDREQAERLARQALQTGRSASDWPIMTASYLLLADIAVEIDPERAVVLLNEGWAIAKEASLDSLAIFFPFILGLAHLKLNEAKLAERSFTEGIDAAKSIDNLPTVSANYIGRAEANLRLERSADAADDLTAGIRLALKTGTGRYLMWAAVVSCQVAAGAAVGSAARDLLLLALHHPAADREARDKAIETLRELFDEDPPPGGGPLSDVEVSLDEVAERCLHLLTRC
jgi:predicted ATPase